MANIEAVLPLISRDLDRFDIFAKSIDKFYPELSVCHVIVPDRQYHDCKKHITHKRYKLIRETDIVPELKPFKETSGWYKQQIIKLAMHEFVNSDQYITFDADVFCVKYVNTDELIVNGKAMSRRTTHDYHSSWYEWAERVLKMKRSGFTHGVTPAIFSVECIRKLVNHLKQLMFSCGSLTQYTYHSLKKLHYIPFNWKSYLLMNTPWTEYSLYNTFIEYKKLFDNYHFDAGEHCIYHKSVWKNEQFDKWDPSQVFNNSDKYYFCVVQSTTDIDPKMIENKISEYFA